MIFYWDIIVKSAAKPSDGLEEKPPRRKTGKTIEHEQSRDDEKSAREKSLRQDKLIDNSSVG